MFDHEPAQVVPDRAQLPDPIALLDAVFDRLMNLPTLGVVFPGCEVGNTLNNIVALVGAPSSSEVLLSTDQNFRTMEMLVAGIKQTLVNNVLRRTATPTDIALARCDVADELLVLITLLVEPTNVDQVMADVVAFF